MYVSYEVDFNFLFTDDSQRIQITHTVVGHTNSKEDFESRLMQSYRDLTEGDLGAPGVSAISDPEKGSVIVKLTFNTREDLDRFCHQEGSNERVKDFVKRIWERALQSDRFSREEKENVCLIVHVEAVSDAEEKLDVRGTDYRYRIYAPFKVGGVFCMLCTCKLVGQNFSPHTLCKG